MKIILKHTLKNIFGKPGRTFLVVLCLLICSFVALFTFDLSNSIDNMLKSTLGQMLGATEITVNSTEPLNLENDENIPEVNYVEIKNYSNDNYFHSDKSYYIVESEHVLILSFDMEKAAQMRFVSFENDIYEGECLVNEDYLEKFGIEIGDTIEVQDVDDNHIPLKVVGKTSDMAAVARGSVIVITDEDMSKLVGDVTYYLTLIDVVDDSKITSTAKYIEEEHPQYSVQDIFGSANMEEQIQQITRIFVLLLAICILMVIFVTISVSDRVICERMAVIGTFRSLGFSRTATTMILLLENTLYGLLGGGLGAALYSLVRIPMFSSIFPIDTGVEGVSGSYGSLSIVALIGVILGAVVVECLCAIKEVLKAVKTPIRDIIFSTKDSEYRFNKVSTIIGIVAMVIGIVMIFIKDVFACQIIAIAAVEIGIAMLSPYFFYFVGKPIAKFFENKGKIIPALAFKESYTKKNTVGASSLIATVVSLCIVVLAYSSSTLYEYTTDDSFTSDVRISAPAGDVLEYQYIANLPGVSDVEFVYITIDNVKINGTESRGGDPYYIYRSPEQAEGWRLNNNVKGAVGNLAEDEIVISKDLAKRYEISVGDNMDIELVCNSPFPVTRTMKVVAISSMDTIPYVVINMELYDHLFANITLSGNQECSEIDIKCDNPVETCETIRKLSDLTADACFTKEEFIQKNQEEASEVITVIKAIIVVACGITFIGAAGNLLIGFEARKRECAVLLSTSLRRGQLAKVFFLESFMSSLLAVLLAIPFGILLFVPVVNVFELLSTPIEAHYDVGDIAITLVVMIIAFALTSLSPIRKLRKMKLAEQLKYE